MRSPRARTATLLTLLAAAAPAPAHAQNQDPLEAGTEVLKEQSCRTLLGGTVNAPDTTVPPAAGALPQSWPPAPAGLLPPSILLRTEHETFNRLYEFATRNGTLYAHVRGDAGPWREMPLPPCFAGRVDSIGADDDELLLLDTGRHVYTMDNALKDPALFNWSSRWGTPFWNGLGYTLPATVAWAWTVVSPAEDKTWTDPAGNHPAVGTFKVSHIWGLRAGGQRLTFWDPWLPLDESYEACGPHRGRFKAVALQTSGSHLAVLGAHGDLFTRLYDFDISGHDPIFFAYSYEDQRGKGTRAKVQLPAEPWTRQPKIPGTITSALSIHKTGVGTVHAILRVEGERDGRTGYWERDIADPPAAGWTFHETGRPLTRPRLDNPAGDTSLVGLGRSEDRRYVMDDKGVHAELEDFNVYCSPARLTVREQDGTVRHLVLHHLDGIRQQVRGRGLDDTPRTQTGAIETPDGRFEQATVRATRDEIVLEERGWRLRLAGPQPLTAQRCLPAAMRRAPRGIGVLTLGATTAQLLTALPAPVRTDPRGRGLRWCVDGGGGAAGVALAKGRVVLVRTVTPRPGARPRVRYVTTRATARNPALLRARLRAAAR